MTFVTFETFVISPLLLLAALLVPAAATADITVDAPSSLAAAAERVRAVDLERLDAALMRAGLTRPAQVQITLIPEDDPRAAQVPRWIVGLALGGRDIVIFPGRVLSYPYDSLESVVRHEIAHLALTTRAGSNDLPRWFHEGVAISVDAGWSVSAQVRLVAAMFDDPGTAQLRRLFASDSESGARQAYLLSAVLIEDLRKRHGAGVPGAIAARIAAGAPFDAAFHEETGETPDAAAARAWRAYRQWTAWLPAITGASAMWAVILLIAFAAYATRMRRRVLRRKQWDEEETVSPPDDPIP